MHPNDCQCYLQFHSLSFFALASLTCQAMGLRAADDGTGWMFAYFAKYINAAIRAFWHLFRRDRARYREARLSKHTSAPLVLLCSIAHCSFPDSISRRLFTQRLDDRVERARTKFWYCPRSKDANADRCNDSHLFTTHNIPYRASTAMGAMALAGWSRSRAMTQSMSLRWSGGAGDFDAVVGLGEGGFAFREHGGAHVTFAAIAKRQGDFVSRPFQGCGGK